ncbi:MULTISPECIES: hypothetical protein [unclassified Lysinibacillus]|uniref:hypothetical protein n=1 Tax=unclassified Lysinibacillus TaxID=2636778 RepID=UPI00087EC9B8|nr:MULTISPECIES: hypothetical protein [unclassified Lysinibacillus]SCZ05549.1 hypothetical protein SAMN02787078_03892 [Lysinibacillus sp. SG9]SDB49892.1 hypothetical protein SAMN02787079_03845 [Lysinibacillus sp. TC-37]SFT09521.1 hypothetical protein SAMN02787087_03505 [Lysinibacillus sp. SG55]
MKKLLILLLGILLVACSQGDESGKKKEGADKASEETLKVDKGLLNVEVTIPATLYKGQDIDFIISEAKNSGIKEVIKNDDGSLTYKMSKSEHKKMMKELKERIVKSVEELKTSEDFTSINDVAYNKSFSEFTLTVNKEKFEGSFDALASFGLALAGMYYQLFNGADVEHYKVTVYIKDESNGEVFDTMVYPDELNENNDK